MTGGTKTLRGALVVLCLVVAVPALAQVAHHPFAIGANEGAVGHQSGLGAWIIGQESRFYLYLKDAVRACAQGGGLWVLLAVAFAYGVFHAAGPGHGKAVIAAYMVANEVALRRGLVIALAAALFQGFLSTAIVGIAALVFNATSARMTAAAQLCELASYLAIVALGLALVWRKGRALVLASRVQPALRAQPASAPMPLQLAAAGPTLGFARTPSSRQGRFFADDGGAHVHGPDCGCSGAHMPDPASLDDRKFNLRAAAAAVVTAGARPCSGAIVVLVFALAQGLFIAGIAATFAMALGTAITTGALAAFAVFAKDRAMKLLGGAEGRRAILGRVIELGAAACVFLFGVTLLTAALSGLGLSS